MNYDIIIPTRDSGKWLDIFIKYLYGYNLKPLYIVDARTRDNTIDILTNTNSRYYIYEPKEDFAESGMIEYGSMVSSAEWIFRLDDDELPNENLIKWLSNSDAINNNDCWKIQRFDCKKINNKLYYSLWPTRFVRETAYQIYNPQLRLFKPSKVKFIEKVHTPGFIEPSKVGFAPKCCFIAHFNNVIRSPSERLNKIRIYAKYDSEVAWRVIDECLPEITNTDGHNFSNNGMDEFNELINKIKIKNDNEVFKLEYEELMNLYLNTQKWLTYTAHTYHSDLMYSLKILKLISKLIPSKALMHLAQILLTTARVIKSKKIQEYGLVLWKLYEFQGQLRDFRVFDNELK